jgi:hypothetical protein
MTKYKLVLETVCRKVYREYAYNCLHAILAFAAGLDLVHQAWRQASEFALRPSRRARSSAARLGKPQGNRRPTIGHIPRLSRRHYYFRRAISVLGHYKAACNCEPHNQVRPSKSSLHFDRNLKSAKQRRTNSHGIRKLFTDEVVGTASNSQQSEVERSVVW